MVMVTLGTGIGGGIVAGGRLLVGANGFAGEFGHMVVDPNGPPCPCGRRGCWERYASGSGLAQLARAAAVGGRLRRRASRWPAAIRRWCAASTSRRRPRRATRPRWPSSTTFARWVALGLVNLTNALDPAAFVLGGGLAEGADLYLEPIERWFRAAALRARAAPAPGAVVRRARRAGRRHRRRHLRRRPPSIGDVGRAAADRGRTSRLSGRGRSSPGRRRSPASRRRGRRCRWSRSTCSARAPCRPRRSAGSRPSAAA